MPSAVVRTHRRPGAGGLRSRRVGWGWWGWSRRLVLAAGLVLGGCRPPAGPRAVDLPEHEAYVWQREWSPAVVEAVTQRAPRFAGLIVLGGEISWRDGRGERMVVSVDPATRRQWAGRRVGIALRVGAFAGSFEPEAAPAGFLRNTARALVAEWREAGVEPAEFQVDFDCSESRLAGYRRWVEAVRADLAPLPVTITALPSWLKRREFAALVRATDGFVLQVHSVSRPRNAREAFDLCDPAAARRWIEQAGALGVPFRVALPTYAYLVAFDSAGRYLGASAEGPPTARPADAVLREVGADPVAMAQLVSEWTVDRPANLRGVLWYRLPVEGDRLNWRWPTLESVMSGRAPVARIAFAWVRPGPGLVEIQATNAGAADRTGPVAVRVRWAGGRLVARDGIRGFVVEPAGETEMLFTNAICRLPAGEAKTIGWLRFESEASVELIP